MLGVSVGSRLGPEFSGLVPRPSLGTHYGFLPSRAQYEDDQRALRAQRVAALRAENARELLAVLRAMLAMRRRDRPRKMNLALRALQRGSKSTQGRRCSKQVTQVNVQSQLILSSIL
jgi:hypothetical protein